MTNNVKALLAWLLSLVGGIVFLVTEKEDKLIRLHAAQSIVAFGAYFVLSIVAGFIGFGLGSLLWLLYVVVMILGAVKAYHGEMYKFPVIGDIATSIFLKEVVNANAPKTQTVKKPVDEEVKESETEFELGTDEKDEEVK